MGTNLVDDGVLLHNYCNNGDEAAARELIERHQRMVFGVCYRILSEIEAAKDVAQAVFMVMTAKATTLSKHSNLTGWLYLTADKIARNERRKMARRRQKEQEAMERMIIEREEKRASASDFAANFDAALASLPEKYRSALALHYLEGVPQAEMASRMKVPDGTINSLLSRARDKLRGKLRQAGCAIIAARLPDAIQTLKQATPPCPDLTVAVQSQMVTGVLSSNSIKIYEETMKNLLYVKIKVAVASVLVAGLITGVLVKAQNSDDAKKSGETLVAGSHAGTSSGSIASVKEPLKGKLEKLNSSEEKVAARESKAKTKKLSSEFNDFLAKGDNWQLIKDRRIRDAQNLKQIGLSLKMFAMDHDGAFPGPSDVAGLELLRQSKYLVDPILYVSPMTGRKPGKNGEALTEQTCDYAYQGGLNEKTTKDLHDTPIAWNKEPHGNFVNVLFGDGHVTGYVLPIIGVTAQKFKEIGVEFRINEISSRGVVANAKALDELLQKKNDVKKAQENALKFIRAKAYVLGDNLARRYPGSKVLLLVWDSSLAKNNNQNVILEGLEEGFAGKMGSVIQGKGSLGKVRDHIGEMNRIINNNSDCDLIVSIPYLPANSKLDIWQLPENERPKLAFLSATTNSCLDELSSSMINAIVTYRPGIRFDKKICPDDPQEAFVKRFLLVTDENMTSLAKKYPKMFRKPSAGGSPQFHSLFK